VKSRILYPDVLNDVYKEAQAQEAALYGTRDILRQHNTRELQSIEQGISRLLSAIKDAGHSQALLKELSTLEQRQLELKQSMAQLDIRPNIQLDASPNDLIAYIRDELENADRIKLAQVLRSLLVEVQATKDYTLKGDITYRLPGIVEGKFIVEL
jgi:hypothetical protein